MSRATIYGIVAGFGLTAVSGFLTAHAFWLQLLGGIFLCYLGWRTLRSKPPEQSAAVQRGSLLKSYTSIFLLTITNPMTILSFTGIFAGLGHTAGSSDWNDSLVLVRL
ncbi:LysE family translocator [Paenibacillus sp. S-38]|uniref:LysE family translocator n=1 Tax=Paenibacillus sp. S-38 TaxID=3416710 RepID=UPI003CFA9CB3